jgi:hypothetical protein
MDELLKSIEGGSVGGRLLAGFEAMIGGVVTDTIFVGRNSISVLGESLQQSIYRAKSPGAHIYIFLHANRTEQFFVVYMFFPNVFLCAMTGAPLKMTVDPIFFGL